MTEEDKTRKINEYNISIEELKTKTTRTATILFFGIILTLYSTNKEDLSNETIKYLLNICGTGISVYHLKKMIELITKRIGLENLKEILELNISEEYTKKLK